MLTHILMMVLETLGGLLTILFLARTVMRWMRLSFINTLGQFILATTNWATVPLQRILPAIGRLDLAALLPAWIIQIALVVLAVLLSGASFGNPLSAGFGLLIIGALDVVKSALYLLLGVVILGAILSWVNPYSPIAPMVRTLSQPFLRPFQRIIPPIANIDLSPLVLLLVIQVLQYVLLNVRNSFMPMLFM